MDYDSESTPNCSGHGLPARLWWTKKQPPRQFYRCPKPIGEQCKFFEWVSPEESTLSQSSAVPPTPDSATPFSQIRPDSPSTPTPAPRNDSAVDPGSLQRNAFYLDVASGSSINMVPRIPAGPDHPNNLIQGLLSPIGLAGALSQLNDMPLRGNMAIPNSSRTSRNDDVQDLSSDVVSDMIRQLGSLPNYLIKLERQKVAADRSREANNTAIINLQEQVNKLEAEVARLRAGERELEAIIATRFEG